METLELGDFTATLVSRLYTVVGDQTARTYYIEVSVPVEAFGERTAYDVTYNISPTGHPDGEISEGFDTLDEVNDYIMGLEGIE